PPRTFTTGSLPSTLWFPTVTVPVSPRPQSDQNAPVLLHMLTPAVHSVPNPVATDLAGNVLWYYAPPPSDLTAVWPVSIVPGGTVLLLGRDRSHSRGEDVLREIDLAGHPLRETNIGALNAQLAARRRRTGSMSTLSAVRRRTTISSSPCAIRIGSSRSITVTARAMARSSGAWASMETSPSPPVIPSPGSRTSTTSTTATPPRSSSSTTAIHAALVRPRRIVTAAARCWPSTRSNAKRAWC